MYNYANDEYFYPKSSRNLLLECGLPILILFVSIIVLMSILRTIHNKKLMEKFDSADYGKILMDKEEYLQKKTNIERKQRRIGFLNVLYILIFIVILGGLIAFLMNTSDSFVTDDDASYTMFLGILLNVPFVLLFVNNMRNLYYEKQLEFVKKKYKHDKTVVELEIQKSILKSQQSSEQQTQSNNNLKCKYCGSIFSKDGYECPFCGAKREE